MAHPADTPTLVGQQLAARRDELDLTQQALAGLIGVTPTTVSATERGKTTISRSKRPRWEAALRLRAGTLARAYRDSTPLETLDPPNEPPEPGPYADMTDPHERALWAIPVAEADRRELIDIYRRSVARRAAEGRNARGRSA